MKKSNVFTITNSARELLRELRAALSDASGRHIESIAITDNDRNQDAPLRISFLWGSETSQWGHICLEDEGDDDSSVEEIASGVVAFLSTGEGGR